MPPSALPAAIAAPPSCLSPIDVSITVLGDHDRCPDLTKPLLADDDKSRSLEDARSGASFVRTCFNGINALSGVGILSIPYALSKGGWLSLGILFMIAIIFYYTGLLLQRCMAAERSINSYKDIGECAFGYKGKVLVSIFLYMELYLCSAGFLILEGDNLDKLFPDKNFHVGTMSIAGKQCFVALVALLILPTTWFRSLGMLAYVSIGGVLASVIVVGCVLWTAFVDGVGFHGRGSFINFGGLPTAVGLYAFSYCGHAMFPTICNSMKDKAKFSKVLPVCFLLCTLNNIVISVSAYLMYGDQVQSLVTLNLPAGRPSTVIAIYTTLINPITKYALTLTPVAVVIEEWLMLDNKRSGFVFVRTALVFSTVVVALAVPFFGNLMALVGSFLGVSVSLLFPCVCYLKIFGASQRQSRIELWIIKGIVVVGVLIAVAGTYSSLREIMSKF